MEGFLRFTLSCVLLRALRLRAIRAMRQGTAQLKTAITVLRTSISCLKERVVAVTQNNLGGHV